LPSPKNESFSQAGKCDSARMIHQVPCYTRHRGGTKREVRCVRRIGPVHHVQRDGQWRSMYQLRRHGAVSSVRGYRPQRTRAREVAGALIVLK
jgi:hypothetical protein